MMNAARLLSRISIPATDFPSSIASKLTHKVRIPHQYSCANYGCELLHNRLPKMGVMDVRATTPRTIGSNRYYVKPHHDMPFPHEAFIEERRDSTLSPTTTAISKDAENSRKLFTYMVLAVGLVPATYGAKAALHQYVTFMAAGADVLALARIEVDLSVIPEGTNVIVNWRCKPLFVRHRTPQQIATEQAVDLSTLRDPQLDSDRVQKPEWLITVGICPHLGCSPIPNAGEHEGGYYCPCHGSHFDASGRIRKGPSPTNMEIPEYFFATETTIFVG